MIDYYVDVDQIKLEELGFTPVEIGILQNLVRGGYKMTSSNLQCMGFTYEQADRLKYAYKICAGIVQVETEEEVVRHFKKMFGKQYKISIRDLAFSNIVEIPKVAVVYGIKQEPYNIWNSSRYEGKNAVYRVIETSSKTVTVETSRKPRLRYGQDREISGVFKIKEVTPSGSVIIQFNRDYIRLCSRFVIVASLRYPEFHLGIYQIVCFEGTRVYVFAKSIGADKNVRYNGNNQRVYDYGIMPCDIKKKLDKAAREIYLRLGGKASEYEEGNSEYRVLDREDDSDISEEDNDIEEHSNMKDTDIYGTRDQ